MALTPPTSAHRFCLFLFHCTLFHTNHLEEDEVHRRTVNLAANLGMLCINKHGTQAASSSTNALCFPFTLCQSFHA